MNIKPKFYGSIWKGDVVHSNVEKIKKHLSQFEDGQEVEIIISKRRKARTSGQPGEETNFNGYYWGVIVKMVADFMGEMDMDYVHGLLQSVTGNIRNTGLSKYPDRPEFCPSEIWELLKTNGYLKGETPDNIPAGTKNMTGGEFSEYCSKCRIWASKELNLSIPEPNEADYEV
jgi:hypothetical protein